MHIATLAQKQDAGGTALASLAVPITVAAPVGTWVVLVVSSNALAGQDGSFGATDNATGGGSANTWTERGHAFKSGTCQLSVLTCQLTRALAIGQTITVTHPAANVILWNVSVEAFDDPTGYDLEFDNTGASNSATSGPSAAGAQANEVIVTGTACGGTPTMSHAAGISDSGQTIAAGSGTRNQMAQWQYVTSGGTRSAATALSASTSWAQVSVVLKATAPQQVVVPDADIVTTGWTQVGGGTGFFTAVDEGSTPDATDYLRSPANPTGVGQKLELSLAAAVAPTDLTQCKVRIYARLNGSSGSGTIKLMQGATVISTATGVTIAPGVFAWYTLSLSSGEAGAITDWSNLTVHFEPTASP